MEKIAAALINPIKDLVLFITRPYLDQEALSREICEYLNRHSYILTNIGFGNVIGQRKTGEDIALALRDYAIKVDLYPKGMFYSIFSIFCSAYPRRKALNEVSKELIGLSNSVFNIHGINPGLRVIENRKAINSIFTILKYW